MVSPAVPVDGQPFRLGAGGRNELILRSKCDKLSPHHLTMAATVASAVGAMSFWLHTSSNFRDESTAMRHSRTTFNH